MHTVELVQNYLCSLLSYLYCYKPAELAAMCLGTDGSIEVDSTALCSSWIVFGASLQCWFVEGRSEQAQPFSYVLLAYSERRINQSANVDLGYDNQEEKYRSLFLDKKSVKSSCFPSIGT